MPLRLITGPANSGKAGLVLDGVRAAVADGRDPLLVLPTVDDVEHYRRELAEAGAAMGVRIVRFTGLIDTIAERVGAGGRVAGEVVLERVAAAVAPPAARGLPGYPAALAGFAAELHAARVAPGRLTGALRAAGLARGDLAAGYRDYGAALARAGLLDRSQHAARALDALRREPRRWGGTPVFLYGFDDFTELELDAVDALARVVDAPVTLSLAYEAGRFAFAGRARAVAELAPLAAEQVVLQARPAHYAAPVLHAIERGLFEQSGEPGHAAGEGVRLLEGGSERAELELVAGEVAALLERGVPAQEIVIVVRSLADGAPLLGELLDAYGVPFTLVRRSLAFARTAAGAGLLGLVRAAAPGGRDEDLFAWLRCPGVVERAELLDGLERELRRRGGATAAAARAAFEAHGGWPLETLDRVADAASRGPVAFVDRLDRELVRLFAAPRRGRAARLAGAELVEARAVAGAREALAELRLLAEAAPGLLGDGALLEALERLQVPAGEGVREGAVAVLEPLGLRARRVRVAFVTGLQDGRFPAPGHGEPLLSDAERTTLAHASGLRLGRREEGLGAERYLFYATVSRPRERLLLSWHAADDDGVPEVRSPFVADVEAHVRGGLPVSERPLGAVDWSGAAAPTAAAESRRRASDGPRLPPAVVAALTAPEVLAWLRERPAWSASALEQYAGCPVRWLIERQLAADDLDPDPEPLARGGLAHAVLERTLRRLGEKVGTRRLDAAALPHALELMREELASCAAERPVSVEPARGAAFTRRLQADLERLLTRLAEHPSRFEPRHLELGFGFADEDEPRPALDLGEGLRIRGRIDRIDVDPESGEAIVIDYKATRALEGGKWVAERSYQLAVYMRAAEQLLGLRAVGGLYQPVSRRDQRPRGIVVEGALTGLLAGDAQEGVEGVAELVAAAVEGLRTAWREATGGRLEPRPATCGPRGQCLHPTICRCER